MKLGKIKKKRKKKTTINFKNHTDVTNMKKSTYYLVICAPSILTTESRGDAWHPGLRSFFWLHTNQKDQNMNEYFNTNMFRRRGKKRRNKSRAIWEMLPARALEFKEAAATARTKKKKMGAGGGERGNDNFL